MLLHPVDNNDDDDNSGGGGTHQAQRNTVYLHFYIIVKGLMGGVNGFRALIYENI